MAPKSKKIIFTDHSNQLLTRYFKDIAKYEVLSNDEIISLMPAIKAGDQKAIDKVCKANLRFVVTIAKQFQNRGVDLMDLISIGNIGLLTCIPKYKPESNVSFVNYAVFWIRRNILKEIYWGGSNIRLPVSQQMLVIKILDAGNKFLQENCREASTYELSEITGISEKQIQNLMRVYGKTTSIDEVFSTDEGDGSTLSETISDKSSLGDDVLNKEYITKNIEFYLAQLSIREHDTLCLLYGIGMNPLAQSDIAKMFGIGEERVRQLKESGIRKLKRRFSNQLEKLI